MEFCAPSTLEHERVYSTPVCQAGYVPPSGFLTLSTVYSSPAPPALFQAGNALGVSALQGFSLTVRFRRLITAECLPGVSSSRRCYNNGIIEAFVKHDPASRISPRTARLQGFAPTANPYSYERNESHLTADPLLSFPAPLGFQPVLVLRYAQRQRSCACTSAPPAPRRYSAKRTIAMQVAWRAHSSATISEHGVLSLSI
jgi:hypothetical protein